MFLAGTAASGKKNKGSDKKEEGKKEYWIDLESLTQT